MNALHQAQLSLYRTNTGVTVATEEVGSLSPSHSNKISAKKIVNVCFALIAFILAFAATLSWKVSDALFLAYVGSELLLSAYAVASVCLIIVGVVVVLAINRLSALDLLGRLLRISCLGFALIALAQGLDVGTNSTWFWFSVKIFSQIFSILSISVFWAFYDQYFPKRYSDKHYALYSCSMFLGTGCAGMALQFLQQGSWSSAIIVCLSLLAYTLSKKVYRTSPLAAPHGKGREELEGPSSLKSFAQSLKGSRVALFLTIGTVALYLLSTTTEYSYLYSFEEHCRLRSETLVSEASASSIARLLGSCVALIGVGNFIAGAFLYSRCIFSLSSLILFTPLIALFAYLGWHSDASLVFPVMGVVLVDGLYPLVEDNNLNALVGAVPSKLKQKMRLLIASFSEPLGMLFSSLLLSASTLDMWLLGLLLALFGVILALMWRTEFLKAPFLVLRRSQARRAFSDQREQLKTG